MGKEIEWKFMEACKINGGPVWEKGQKRRGLTQQGSQDQRSRQAEQAPIPLPQCASIRPLPASSPAQDSKTEKTMSDCPNLNHIATSGEEEEGRSGPFHLLCNSLGLHTVRLHQKMTRD